MQATVYVQSSTHLLFLQTLEDLLNYLLVLMLVAHVVIICGFQHVIKMLKSVCLLSGFVVCGLDPWVYRLWSSGNSLVPAVLSAALTSSSLCIDLHASLTHPSLALQIVVWVCVSMCMSASLHVHVWFLTYVNNSCGAYTKTEPYCSSLFASLALS